METEQLEFEFIGELERNPKKIKEKSLQEWITEHVRPDIGWTELPFGYEPEIDKPSNMFQNVADHIRIGVVFKWKF